MLEIMVCLGTFVGLIFITLTWLTGCGKGISLEEYEYCRMNKQRIPNPRRIWYDG